MKISTLGRFRAAQLAARFSRGTSFSSERDLSRSVDEHIMPMVAQHGFRRAYEFTASREAGDHREEVFFSHHHAQRGFGVSVGFGVTFPILDELLERRSEMATVSAGIDRLVGTQLEQLHVQIANASALQAVVKWWEFCLREYSPSFFEAFSSVPKILAVFENEADPWRKKLKLTPVDEARLVVACRFVLSGRREALKTAALLLEREDVKSLKSVRWLHILAEKIERRAEANGSA